MPNQDPKDDLRQILSSLMDGDDQGAEQACRAWHADAQARADWHMYHLIGDLLRSDEHRADAGRDARFVAAVRDRLAQEPVVLAPEAARPARRTLGWRAPAAVAAGFVAVAGVLVVLRSGAPAAGSDAVAVLASSQGAAVSASAPSAEQPPVMIRDADLDRYLAAHRQLASGSTLAAPGRVVRSVAVVEPGR